MQILEVKNLCKKYVTVKAVDDISFSIQSGDIFAFLGPNGAGKTTTLRILLNIIKGDSGSVSWFLNGKESKTPDPTLTGYLPEERGLYTDLPVLRTLVYLAAIRGMDKVEAQKAAMQWLERFEIANRAKEKLQNLSKGNQQKVQFIASILHKPSFAILDEPFSGLDPLNQEFFIELIQELNNEGCTIILSSHQMQLVEKLARKILLINKGKTLYHGLLTDIYKNQRNKHVIELGFKNPEADIPATGIEGVESIEKMENGKVMITFKPEYDLSRIMHILSGMEGISEVGSHNRNLHDIYIDLVAGAETANK